jgi:hypothetical protein
MDMTKPEIDGISTVDFQIVTPRYARQALADAACQMHSGF